MGGVNPADANNKCKFPVQTGEKQDGGVANTSPNCVFDAQKPAKPVPSKPLIKAQTKEVDESETSRQKYLKTFGLPSDISSRDFYLEYRKNVERFQIGEEPNDQQLIDMQKMVDFYNLPSTANAQDIDAARYKRKDKLGLPVTAFDDEIIAASKDPKNKKILKAEKEELEQKRKDEAKKVGLTSKATWFEIERAKKAIKICLPPTASYNELREAERDLKFCPPSN